jgi:hypothetical protein
MSFFLAGLYLGLIIGPLLDRFIKRGFKDTKILDDGCD